jgi:hypothetical protein
LISGRAYVFYIQARNSVGYSLQSAPLTIYAAQAPDTPNAPISAISGDFVSIKWTIPYDGSSSITGYKILVRSYDNSTFVENPYCNGLTSVVVASLTCSVPI